MTHGEFRGLLVLSGLMVAVVFYSWVSKPRGVAELAASPNVESLEQQSDRIAAGLQLSTADSLIIEVSARNSAHSDSVRRSPRVAATVHSRSKVSNDKTASTRKGKRKSRESRQPDLPSPLERDI